MHGDGVGDGRHAGCTDQVGTSWRSSSSSMAVAGSWGRSSMRYQQYHMSHSFPCPQAPRSCKAVHPRREDLGRCGAALRDAELPAPPQRAAQVSVALWARVQAPLQASASAGHRSPASAARALAPWMAARMLAPPFSPKPRRDIKPTNVVLDGNGRVRLIDFGSAKVMVEPFTSSATGTPLVSRRGGSAGHRRWRALC